MPNRKTEPDYMLVPLPDESEDPESSTTAPLDTLHVAVQRNSVGKVYTVGDAIEHIGIGRTQYALLVAVSLTALAQGMDVTFLSILPSQAGCAFTLTSWHRALLTMAYFIGCTCGAFLFGWVGDRFGRKLGVMAGISVAAYTSILVLFAYSYPWLVVLRFVTGIGLGAFSLRNSWMFEVLPTAYRVRAACVVLFFWTTGTAIDAPLFLLPNVDWKNAMAIAFSPLFIALIIMLFIPESPRLLLNLGYEEDACEALERFATWNGTTLPPGELVTEEEKAFLLGGEADGGPMVDSKKSKSHEVVDFLDLFRNREMLITTVALSFIWFALFFSDFGMYIMTSELLQIHGINTSIAHASDVSCTPLLKADLISIMLANVASFPGLMIFFLLMDFVGRRKAIAANCFLSAAVIGVLLIPNLGRAALTALLSALRAVMTAAFKVLLVYTPEVFPTRLRTRGNGLCLAIGQIGTIFTPLAAQVLLRESKVAGESIYLVFCAAAGVAALLLPIETAGRALPD